MQRYLEPHFMDRCRVSSCRTAGIKSTGFRLCLQVCSSGGCTSTSPLSFLTASAPPQNQPPPGVSATGPHTLNVSWEPPRKPNGRTSNIVSEKKTCMPNCSRIHVVKNKHKDVLRRLFLIHTCLVRLKKTYKLTNGRVRINNIVESSNEQHSFFFTENEALAQEHGL